MSIALQRRWRLDDLRALDETALRVTKDSHLPERSLEGALDLSLIVCL